MRIETLRKTQKILWVPAGITGLGALFNAEVWGTQLLIAIGVIIILIVSLVWVQVKIDRHPDAWKEK